MIQRNRTRLATLRVELHSPLFLRYGVVFVNVVVVVAAVEVVVVAAVVIVHLPLSGLSSCKQSQSRAAPWCPYYRSQTRNLLDLVSAP